MQPGSLAGRRGVEPVCKLETLRMMPAQTGYSNSMESHLLCRRGGGLP
jgi:hypothetical protein